MSNHFHSKASTGVGPIGSNLVALSGELFYTDVRDREKTWPVPWNIDLKGEQG